VSLIPHLSGSPILSTAVGKDVPNKPADVKLIKALLNPWLRANSQPAMSMDGTGDETLIAHIEKFQKEEQKTKAPDGRVDPGGKTLGALRKHLRGRYTLQAAIAPTAGLLTWDTEGAEGGLHHSRRLHVPSAGSGLTIGRGYDLRYRSSASIQKDLVGVGVPATVAFKIGGAAKLSGAAASRYVIDNDLLDFEISPRAQLELFEKVYAFMLKEVKRISDKPIEAARYGKVDWNKLDQRILDVLVDLMYRGDYGPKTRALLQKHVANNDFDKFRKEIANASNWPNVISQARDRFERRKAYVETPARAYLPRPISGMVWV
jgi:hypothetical protein